MAAPVQYYVNNSGSLFKIDKHQLDLELVTNLHTKPLFPGSGSISVSSFKIISDGVEQTIDNSQAIKDFNKNAYYFPFNKYNFIDVNVALNLNFRYSSSLNYIIISPKGDFAYPLKNYYGLDKSNVSKSFYNSINSSSYNFNSNSIAYISDVSSSVYQHTVITPNTSSLGPDSTGSIFLSQSLTEYRYDYISASIDLYNDFLDAYYQLSSSLKSIKGSIN